MMHHKKEADLPGVGIGEGDVPKADGQIVASETLDQKTWVATAST